MDTLLLIAFYFIIYVYAMSIIAWLWGWLLSLFGWKG